MLEALEHSASSFVTLTYSEDHLTRVSRSGGAAVATLVPSDLQLFLKRLRKAVEPTRIRFYGVGEYGDQTQRPHFHVALFGFPPCVHGKSPFMVNTTRKCCAACNAIASAWGLGSIVLGTLTSESAQYVAGYVTKKMTNKNDKRLDGRHPEFARMSLRPGIGAGAMHEVAKTVSTYNLTEREGDVPTSLRHGARTLPLGRYLRRKLRAHLGLEPATPQDALNAYALTLLPLLEAAKASADYPSLKHQIIKEGVQKVIQMETRNRIFKKRGSI